MAKVLALGRLGNLTEAILYYDKALAIDPHYVNALTGKGTADDTIKFILELLNIMIKQLVIQPNDTYALDNKGLALDDLYKKRYWSY